MTSSSSVQLTGMLGTQLQTGDTPLWTNFSLFTENLQLEFGTDLNGQAEIAHLFDAVRALSAAVTHALELNSFSTQPTHSEMRRFERLG